MFSDCETDDSQLQRVHRIDPSQFMLPRNDSYQCTTSQMSSHEVQSLPRSPENMQPNGLQPSDMTPSPHSR